MVSLSLEEFCHVVSNGLDQNMSTNEIADELGLQYESVRRRLHKNGKDELRLQLNARRSQEWERRKQNIEYNYYRNRCTHGAWSASGACEHGAMGRNAKEAA